MLLYLVGTRGVVGLFIFTATYLAAAVSVFLFAGTGMVIMFATKLF